MGILENVIEKVTAPEKNVLLNKLERQRENVTQPSTVDHAEQVKQREHEILKRQSLSVLVALLQMFRYTNSGDKLILFIGIVFTVIHGASFPIMAMLFGSVTETFITQSLNNPHSNITMSSEDSLLQHNLSARQYAAFPTTPPPSNATPPVQVIFNLNVGGDTGSASAGNVNGNETSAQEVFGAIGNVLGSFGPQRPLSTLSQDEFMEYAETLTYIYIGIGLVVFISSFIQTACWEWVADTQTYRLREAFLFQVLRQEMPWFESRTAGYLIVKLADDVERVREGLGHKFSIMIEYSACFAVGAFFGLSTNWKLAMIFGSSVPFILMKILVWGSDISAKCIDQQEKIGRAGAFVVEVLTNVRTVAAYGTEMDETVKYVEICEEGIEAANAKHNLIGVSSAIIYVFIYMAYIGGFMYAVSELEGKNITPREVYTVFFCVAVSILALVNILNFVSTTANAFASTKVIMSIVDSKPDIDPYSMEGRRPSAIAGQINISAVTFHYPSRADISALRNLSMVIKSGESVAIIGASGSGKSTIVNLLMRFYDPEDGQITFDDVDLKKLNVTWLREQIGVVSQRPFFDEATIYDNLNGSNTEADIEDVQRACKLACATDFINKLPMKYDTVIGITGRQLSVGQNQRLAIARALIRNPAVLILDEATSGLDTATANLVHQNIKRVRRGRTTISISHRLSHIRKVDTIYVLKDGSLIGSGTHAELMANSTYHTMVLEQNLLQTLETQESLVFGDEDDLEITEPEVEDEENLVSTDVQLTLSDERAPPSFGHEGSAPAFPSVMGIYEMLKEDETLVRYLFWGLVGTVISGCIVPTFAILFSNVFITFGKNEDTLAADTRFWMYMVLILSGAAALGIYLRMMCLGCSAEFLASRLRQVAFLSISRQAMEWFDQEINSVGRLYTRLACDAPFILAAIGTRMGAAISAIVTIIVGISISFVLEWQLGVVIACAFPILFLGLYIQTKVYHRRQMHIATHIESGIRLATKSVQNIWTIQALNLEQSVLRRFKEFVDPAFLECHKQSITYSLIFAILETLSFLVFAGVFKVGIILIQTEDVDSILLFKAFIILIFCGITMSHLTSYTPDFVKARLSSAHILQIYDLESTIDCMEENGEYPDSLGHVEFRDVHFSYPTRPHAMVLQGVTFDLPAGKCLGIIGLTGKSTLLGLLERFYDVNSGEILIDGVDVRKIKLDYMRENIGYVAQEPVLFNRTIRDNILYGYKGEEEGFELEGLMQEAAADAFISDFINQLPKDFNTMVGERGSRLTGGQRQRIAIARALIRNPKILILDDPTAALDPQDELVVENVLTKARIGRTCIITSNRPSIIHGVDVVAVLIDGKVAEYGTHEELENLQGFYHEFMKASQHKHT